ncbi:MAG: Beta-phosphoglucomutase [Alphaproteobacteria bacterium MarineAlpha5_Bin6]|nr:MAG: Beta-phosphoglucomutase [Alphaproteobacteria bacterium MarineAlpha5_Bin6]|tara:strand:- start:109 stop:744 length:636 start_codon:yes stop_codon:yes gene_type:complete
MIKAIFFDLDGTLIKSMEDHYISWSYVLKKYHNITLDKKFFFFTEGTKLQVLLKQIFYLNNKKCTVKQIKKLILLKDEYYKLKFKVKFYPRVKKTLGSLSKKKILLYIVTSGSKKRVFRTLPNDFIDLFENIITGDDCLRGKPFPDPYLKALKTSKTNRKNCLIVENTPLGIASGKKAKIKTLGITNTLPAKHLCKADKIIKSIEDVKKFI